MLPKMVRQGLVRVLLGLILALPFAAVAEGLRYTDPSGDTLLITSEKCENQMLAYVPDEYKDGMKAASAQVDGKPFAACWTFNGAAVVVVYEDGDVGLVSLEFFVKDT